MSTEPYRELFRIDMCNAEYNFSTYKGKYYVEAAISGKGINYKKFNNKDDVNKYIKNNKLEHITDCKTWNYIQKVNKCNKMGFTDRKDMINCINEF